MLKQKYKAFSVVELFVVVAIMGILASVSWTIFGKSKKTVDVSGACEQVASMINKTRNYVISGRTNFSTFRIWDDGSTINSAGDGLAPEKYSFKGGIKCGNNSIVIDYVAPDGVGSWSGNIDCVGDGITKTVKVTPYQAVCK